MSDSFAVTVEVRRADGSSEQVRVGTATRSASGFAVSFLPMMIQTNGAPVSAAAPARRSSGSSAGGGAGGAVFPPYGRSKGMPVYGATMQDLEFYASGSRRTLADPSKARFHDKERSFLAVLEAEIMRQQGGGGGGQQDLGSGSAPDDSEIPPPGDEDAPF